MIFIKVKESSAHVQEVTEFRIVWLIALTEDHGAYDIGSCHYHILTEVYALIACFLLGFLEAGEENIHLCLNQTLS